MAVIRRHWRGVLLNALAVVTCVLVLFYGLMRPVSRSRIAAAAPAVGPAGPATRPAAYKPKRALDPALNVHVASVADAMKNHRNGERLSGLLGPHKFDPKAFAVDSHAYLDVVEPGRVWDSAQPGPGVKEIEAKDSCSFTVAPAASVALTVLAAPQAPVTFTSFDLGAFQNQLTSITVQADAKGEATATFTATEGTDGPTNILAASPLNSGHVRLLVTVVDPQPQQVGPPPVLVEPKAPKP